MEIEYDNTRVLFSGDIGTVRTPVIRDPNAHWEQPVDAVVIESTYGNRTHKPRPDTVAELKAIVEQVLIPTQKPLVSGWKIPR